MPCSSMKCPVGLRHARHEEHLRRSFTSDLERSFKYIDHTSPLASAALSGMPMPCCTALSIHIARSTSMRCYHR